jgi:tetratricopeptide (TPR) repeat protein
VPGPGGDVPAIPGYEILGELGRGGMGVVYKARQVNLGRLVALKMIRTGGSAGSSLLARFRTEAEVVARLHHANIVQIHDIADAAGGPFLSLELLGGGSLAGRIAGTPQPPRDSADLLVTLASAIHAAHEAGVVHRDLKPANILFTADGVPKVTDFGLAKRLQSEDGQTMTGMVMGTPSYMAPEQARGRTHEIGPQADVYALGAILYEMLTGRPPFKGPSSMETVRQVIEEDPVAPSRLQSRVPRDVETICLKCLRKEPHRRYASAAELAADLGRYLAGETILARRTPPWERAAKWARRHPTAATLLALALAASATAVGVAIRLDAEANRRRLVAERRLAAWRVEGESDLLKAQAAGERGDRAGAIQLLAQLRTKVAAEPRLAGLLARSDELLGRLRREDGRQKAREQDRDRLRRFAALRDEALRRDTRFAGLDAAGGGDLVATRDAARAALALFGGPSGSSLWTPGDLPDSLSPAERSEVRRGCYELLLVWAQAATDAPALAASEAESALAAALAIRPAPTRAYLLRLAAARRKRGGVVVGRLLEAWAARVPLSGPFDHFLLGRETYKQGQWAEAIAHFERALREQPDLFWAQCLMAICYLQDRRPAEARHVLDGCVRAQPETAWVRLLRGHALDAVASGTLRRADTAPPAASGPLRDEAEALFEAAEDDFHAAEAGLRGRNADLHYVLLVDRGLMRLNRRRPAEALADLEAARTLNPRPFFAHGALANAYLALGREDEAMASLDAAVGRKPGPRDLASLHRQRATLLLRRGEAEAAVAALERAASSDPRDRKARAGDHARRGEVLLDLKRPAEAVAAFAAALEDDPGRADAHLWRAKAQIEAGDERAAIGSCEAALALGSRSPEVLALLAEAHARRGDLAGAIGDYTRALDARPGQPWLHARRGWAYLLSGAPKLALADFDEAVRLDPGDADAHGGRADALSALGRPGEAVAAAEEALNKGASREALYFIARSYARAADAAARGGRRGDADFRLAAAYQRRASAVLARALRELPEERRPQLWAEIRREPALATYRNSAWFSRLPAPPRATRIAPRIQGE